MQCRLRRIPSAYGDDMHRRFVLCRSGDCRACKNTFFTTLASFSTARMAPTLSPGWCNPRRQLLWDNLARRSLWLWRGLPNRPCSHLRNMRPLS